MRTRVSVSDRSEARTYLEDALQALRTFEAGTADPEHAWALDVAAREMALAAAAKLREATQSCA